MSFLNSFATLLLVMTSLAQMTSSAEHHVGQVKVYVDQSAKNNWHKTTGKTGSSEFETELKSLFLEINEILKSLGPNGVNIQLQIDEIIMLNKNILTVDSKGWIRDTKAIKQFKDFVLPSYSTDKYDLAILFTGTNLASTPTSDNTAGYAFIGAVCSSEALAVVELRNFYMDVLMACHEIGHVLGAEHDGTTNAKACGPESGEVLNPLVSLWSPKHFTYSACTAKQIKDKLDRLAKENNNCMASWSDSKAVTAPRYGTLMTPDELCQRRFGPASYVARKAYSTYGDGVCTQLACMTKTVGTYFNWAFTVTPPGLKCGKNKQCISGKCVETSSGSDQVTDWCPFGDQPKIEGDYQMTCADMTLSMCPGWKNTCCHTCRDPGTADDVCRQLVGKDSSLARRAYQSYGEMVCSKLACLTDVTPDNVFHWRYFSAPDGMVCGKSKRCNNQKCVSTKTGDPKISDTCPFGDQPWLAGSLKTTCGDYVSKNGCSASGIKELCCGSCTDPGTPDEVCQRLEGPNTAMARYHYNSYGDNLCSQLACLNRIDGWNFYWNYHPTPDGMKCGKNKRCVSGKCVHSVTGDPNMPNSCPYGDQPYLSGNYKSDCPSFVKNHGCTGIGMYQICCKSCVK